MTVRTTVDKADDRTKSNGHEQKDVERIRGGGADPELEWKKVSR